MELKMHSTLIEQLITLFEVNSGWREQSKLRSALANFGVTLYTQENGDQTLVSTKELNNKLREQKGL
tara:strand:- start:8765 stop:8965 length:201 start_codon:yes stop_codon:yes gene_type:complete